MAKYFIRFISITKANIGVLGVVLFYLFVAISLISWGIPNNNHPFSYHMDEWAQAQSLRTTFSRGTPHIHGGGNGTFFFYIVSGVLLAPFILLRVVNPFAIKSSIDFVDLQHMLFIVLRLQSILYVLLSIILISYIGKKYFKANPFLTAFFFAINPITLILSEFYRYDAPVVFFIILSFLFSLAYLSHPTRKNFFVQVIIAAFAVTIKVGALPLFVTMLGVYVIANSKKTRKMKDLFMGALVFALVFLVAGVPDILIAYKQFFNWFYYSAFSVSFNISKNVHLDAPFWIYFLTQLYPAIYGKVTYVLGLCSIVFWSYVVTHKFFSGKKVPKNYLLLLLSTGIFILSLIPLSFGARANRMFVLLPFMALLISLFIYEVKKHLGRIGKLILVFLITATMAVQLIESFSWVQIKLNSDLRQTSSIWIKNNIPKGSEIGLEDVPIFQDVPDLILKDYYTKQYKPNYKTLYLYQKIDSKTASFPTYVILTREEVESKYFKESEKKTILSNLKKQKYKKLITFTPMYSYFNFFNNEKVFFFSGLSAIPPTISIYVKP